MGRDNAPNLRVVSWDNVRDRWSQYVTHICDICRPKLEEIVFPKDISK